MLTHQLRPLAGVRFQVLFTPRLGVLFTFPSRYWFTIGLLDVFSLTGWCRLLQTGLLQPRPTQDPHTPDLLASKGLSPALADFPKSFEFACQTKSGSYYPPGAVTPKVWALSRSLATTEEITTCFLFL